MVKAIKVMLIPNNEMCIRDSKSSNEDNRIAYSKTGNNTLNVICVVEEET